MEPVVLAPLRRYEFKYLVPSRRLPELRAAVAPYCTPDKHTGHEGTRHYTITSLYYDTPSWWTYRAKKNRHEDRFKLRVRTYGKEAEGPIFMEVKRKVGDTMIKYRERIGREGWADRGPDAVAARQVKSAWERPFHFWVARLGARPALLVRYQREAFASVIDLYARVTFDHTIVVQAAQGRDFVGDPRAWRNVDHPRAAQLLSSVVVLELKFTANIPSWMMQIVRRLELFRVGFSKYCTGVESLHGPEAPGMEQVRVPPPGRRLGVRRWLPAWAAGE